MKVLVQCDYCKEKYLIDDSEIKYLHQRYILGPCRKNPEITTRIQIDLRYYIERDYEQIIKQELIDSLKIPEPGSYEELMYSHEEFRELIKHNTPRREGIHTIIYEPRQSGRRLIYKSMSARKRLRAMV